MRQANLNLAVAELNERLKKNPSEYLAKIYLAKCYFKMKEYGKFLENLKSLNWEKLKDDEIGLILEMTNWQLVSSPHYFNGPPVFSADGKYLAYASARRDTDGDSRITIHDRGGIYIYDIKNHSETYLVSDEYYNSNPVFSPDGHYLLYFSSRQDDNNDKKIDDTERPSLYLADLSNYQEQLLFGPEMRIKHPRFSQDGQKIIFVAWLPKEDHSGIYSYDIKTKKLQSLVTPYYETAFPVLSPDGTKLIYTSWRRDTNKDGVIDIRDNSGLFMKDLISGRETEIVSDDYNNEFPQFSPNGEMILYLSRRRDTNKDGVINNLDNSGIYIYHLLKRKEELIVEDDFFNKFPSFSFDNKEIVFLSNWRVKRISEHESKDYFETKGIYLVDIRSKNITQVISDKYYGHRAPVLSPKEPLVSYLSWRPDTGRGIYLANYRRLPEPDELRKIIESFV